MARTRANPVRSPARAARGDFQTPHELAVRVLRLLGRTRARVAPATIIEPTCGRGNFLLAAAQRYPSATLRGYELNPAYVRAARSRLARAGVTEATVHQADVFTTDWEAEVARWDPPVLVVGNPPWVTNAGLSVLGSENRPARTNFKALPGLAARTGKSNFDVSEWITLRLLAALQGRQATIALLIKTAVARRVLAHAWTHGLRLGGPAIARVDAHASFGVNVDACLFVARPGARRDPRDCAVYDDLGGGAQAGAIGMRGGRLVADARAWDRVDSIEGYLGRAVADPPWRSGIKHDCARVMELEPLADRGELTDVMRFRNGLGEEVTLDAGSVYPLLKSSDLANGRTARARRWVIVPQTRVGEDTARTLESWPRTRRYLEAHGARLDARKSSVYRNQPRFAIFGVGEYSFRPWKVAISGLYKRPAFALVGPQRGRPVMLDDTCYALGFDREAEARRALDVLRSERAQDVIQAFTFWDAKRPITKEILSRLDLARLAAP